MSEKKKEGWGKISNSQVWHYFLGTRSLCNRWMLMSYSHLESEEINKDGDTIQKCKLCEDRRAKRAILFRKRGETQSG